MIFIIALSLSMDAFSLALAYGTIKLDSKNMIILSSIVGVFHFIMPIIGNSLGIIILDIIKIKPNIIVAIILSFIGLEMCLQKEEKIKQLENIYQMILFAIAVSIDSFSVGITLSALTQKIILSSLTFALTAGIITFIGLKLGNKITTKLEKKAPIIGGIVLIIIGIIYVFK